MISQTLFSSRKDSYPTWRFFFSIRALSSWYFNLEFLKTGHEWVLGVNIFWYCTFRFTCSKQEHQYLSWQTLIFFWKLNSYAVVQLCTTKQPGWPFDWDWAHCCNLQCSSFLFKANCIWSQKQVAKFISVSKFSLHLRAEPATVKVEVLWEFLGGDVPLGPWNP